jgi:deoxyuridine 5'-triphosphate nucleotidohydrolase
MSIANTKNKFLISRLNNEAKIPTRATAGSAGYDLYASEENIIIAGNRGIIKTGLMIEIPKGYCGQVWPRSGFSAKNGIESGAGIIDSDYRGELMIILYNHSLIDFKVEKHMRMAQLILVKIDLPIVIDTTLGVKPSEDMNNIVKMVSTKGSINKFESDTAEFENIYISKNLRGTGGFGSTGTK